MKSIKQVIIVRADLKMSKGKESAQVAHASMKVYFDCMKLEKSKAPCFYLDENKQIAGHYDINFVKASITMYDTHPMYLWAFDPEYAFTKIVLCCNSKEELLDLYKEAKDANLPCALIKDNGQTEFKRECPDCDGTGYKSCNLGPVPCIRCDETGRINDPTYTTLAIGPAYSEDIDKITKRLSLRR